MIPKNNAIFLKGYCPRYSFPCGAVSDAGRRAGFTLIELLVVMSIIMVLASMLLPSLSRAKEKAKTITCVNNLHQISIAIKLYVDDNDNKFPAATVRDPDINHIKSARAALGGRDPIPRVLPTIPSANRRPLFSYLAPSEVYRCPADKGQRLMPCPYAPMKPSNWEVAGCSYQYNAGALTVLAGGGFRKTPADSAEGLAGKPEGWVTSPVHYILMHEPPARPYGCIHGVEWYQWHYSRLPTDIDDPVLARQQFYSPLLCVDGHVAVYNFSKALTTDPYYPYEPTKDWLWYKPVTE